MIAAVVMVAGLAGAYDPVPEVRKVPGPYFLIPCKVDGIKDVARVQLFVSKDRGKSWELYDEITPDTPAFTFSAKKPGEYWFTARLKLKNGLLNPADSADFVPLQRTLVETGTEQASAARTHRAEVDELADELARVELDLIRKEIKRLAEQKEFTRDTEEKIDRLRDAHFRLHDRDEPRVAPPGSTIPPLPVPIPPYGIDDRALPPTTTPTDPLLIPMIPPALPEAPMPRVRERR